MAVTKIRKISSWTMIIVVGITAAVFGLFFFGGYGEPIGEFKNPIYTGEMLIWGYVLLAICAVSMLLFGLVQFGGKFKTNPKAALLTLGIFVSFALLLIVAYSLGDGTPLTARLNAETQPYNIPLWLKTTDMWLYTMYILFVLCGIAMLWSAGKKILTK